MIETLVIALGGNAITRPDEPGTIPQQFAHTSETLEYLLPVIRAGHNVVITHGNGPQIGNILIRSEEGERRVPPLPLDTCVADSQGGMGYMIQRLATALFRRENIRRGVACVITQVLVDRNDPEFANPTKPVGSFYSAAEAAVLRHDKPHWILREIEPGRFRRVVPSPRPLEVLEKDAIFELSQSGSVVVACGGGGIPVAWEGNSLLGVEGVIDKDRASSLLATQIRAHKLIIVTSVDQVAIRYHKPGQKWLGTLTVAEARAHMAAGEFPPGSMGPKIESAIDFIEQGGEECIITSTEQVAQALEGNAGTHIVAAWGSRSLNFPPAQK
ncbi:MAG: carbamate kinase [Acidobacteria bacterium]|nr:carbamate kinase [Acidobacteriota bacterium]MCL5286938.1 carbamate kinase [Acidobacteriota bacterium]